MKNFSLFFFLIFSTVASSQSFGEVEIKGSIKVPAEADPQGISIYNKTSGKGSVSTEKGNFVIFAKLNDSLYFSALQYKDLLFVVDEQTFRTGRLDVVITENINDLPEVVVRPHNLTGNLNVDVDNIPVVPLSLPTKSAFSINDYDYEFRADGQTSVRNAAMPSGGLQNGVDPLAIIGGILSAVLPAKKAKKPSPVSKSQMSRIQLERELKNRYENAFFEEVLNIKVSEIANFIDFIVDSGIREDLLDKNREMDLIQLMVDQSKLFKEEN